MGSLGWGYPDGHFLIFQHRIASSKVEFFIVICSEIFVHAEEFRNFFNPIRGRETRHPGKITRKFVIAAAAAAALVIQSRRTNLWTWRAFDVSYRQCQIRLGCMREPISFSFAYFIRFLFRLYLKVTCELLKCGKRNLLISLPRRLLWPGFPNMDIAEVSRSIESKSNGGFLIASWTVYLS